MKKFISAFLALLFVLTAFSACRKKNGGDDTSENTTDSEIETTAPDTTADTEPDTTEADTTAVAKPGQVSEIKLDKYSVNVSVGTKDMPMVTMLPESAENKAEIWESDNTSVATVDKYGNITGVSEGKCTVTVTSADNKNVSAKVAVTVSAPVGLTYIQGILVVNKTYSLPSDYNPGVDSTAKAALDEMTAAAAKDGVSLWIVSGFRSYTKQTSLYNNYVARDGKAEADRYSARPGYSEHQTGLAFDLNSLDQSFGQTKEGKWIAANSWKYGFILRYPQEKEAQTGYMYEPWHVRYLGKDVAKKVYDSGLCLEEYLNITSVYAN